MRSRPSAGRQPRSVDLSRTLTRTLQGAAADSSRADCRADSRAEVAEPEPRQEPKPAWSNGAPVPPPRSRQQPQWPSQCGQAARSMDGRCRAQQRTAAGRTAGRPKPAWSIGAAPAPAVWVVMAAPSRGLACLDRWCCAAGSAKVARQPVAACRQRPADPSDRPSIQARAGRFSLDDRHFPEVLLSLSPASSPRHPSPAAGAHHPLASHPLCTFTTQATYRFLT